MPGYYLTSNTCAAIGDKADNCQSLSVTGTTENPTYDCVLCKENYSNKTNATTGRLECFANSTTICTPANCKVCDSTTTDAGICL